MIPKLARRDLLNHLFNAGDPKGLTARKIFLFTNNATVNADTVLADLTPCAQAGMGEMPFPNLGMVNQCVNSENQGESDSHQQVFTATGSVSAFQVYGFGITYENYGVGFSGTKMLFGVVKFTDPVPVNAPGNKVVCNVNIYADDYTPSGACAG